MPRCRRVKSHDSIYHIMVRSIKEVPLFKETKDKELYLSLVKEYQKQYGFKVYAYCLMDNHGHLIIDANGADISKIMHGIDFNYAQLFNKIHNRHGHLFQDRFKSKIIKDERYIITLSLYIHNNPTDIEGYEKNPENYLYSSLSAYIGLKKDPYGILDEDFIMRQFGNDKSRARNKYKNKISKCNSNSAMLSKELELKKEEVEFMDEKTEYRSGRKILIRDLPAVEIIEYISNMTNTDKIKLKMKNSRTALEARALAVLLMRNLCSYKCSEICETLGNITESRVSKLCSIGVRIIDENIIYKNIISSFIEQYAVHVV